MKKRELNFAEIKLMKDGYIPAPYELEEGEQINDFYLEPVYFENENGVRICGIYDGWASSGTMDTTSENVPDDTIAPTLNVVNS